MRIAVVGAGWYGCHVALELRKQGIEVVVFEKQARIFNGISGTFGIRLHTGPHYPRSKGTRLQCQKNFNLFSASYPELVNQHAYSIYGLGDIDADGKKSKVERGQFDKVCREFKYKKQINPGEYGYDNLISAHDIDEPSLTLGVPLRAYFEKRIQEAGIDVNFNFNPDNMTYKNEGVTITHNRMSSDFDYVVNATSFKALVPEGSKLPMRIDYVYQPCLALVYKDNRPESEKPISFIAMDGWFPCLMPYNDGESHKYILTHGKWTILNSCQTNAEAESMLAAVNDNFIQTMVRSECEKQIERFYPGFKDRFEYQDFKGSVIAKPVTNTEFRSALTFYEKQKKLIHIIPGKVSCIFDVSKEVLSIISQIDLKTDPSNQNFQYVNHGMLDMHTKELTDTIDDQHRNTCYLKTFSIFKSLPDMHLLSPSTQHRIIESSMDIGLKSKLWM